MANNAKKVTNWLLLNETSVKTHVGNDARVKPRNRPPIRENKHSRRDTAKETELTKSPVSGTYIIKEWSEKSLSKKNPSVSGFSKSEIELNSIAASFVEITPQARAKLQRIHNKIGPYECKLCKVVYGDAFELAMHNCPRVVHIEYR